jgi:hypothetical protein
MRVVKLIPSSFNTVTKRGRSYRRLAVFVGVALISAGVTGGVLFSLPIILAIDIGGHQQQVKGAPLIANQFPVTVDPQRKVITEDPQVNTLLESPSSPLQAAADSGNIFSKIFESLAASIANAPWYESIGAVDAKFVTITPGMRKEQVANAFGAVLKWSAAQKKQFSTTQPYAALPLAEGSFSPGTYLVSNGMTPVAAQQLVNAQFNADVLSHYGTATAQVVPLDQALTVASLIEREAGDPSDMRLISGIIWNRLFNNMALQIDATLQYAKATKTAKGNWWPTVLPADKNIVSPYNTYKHTGLPPTPIATPSVAAVLAALNPVNTSCLFYFHDNNGVMHCSDTYAQHVALLKKYFGHGK